VSRAIITAEHRDRLVARLPAMAVRAVVDAASPQPGQALDGGKLVGHPGGQQQPAGPVRLTAGQRHLEPVAHPGG
jgi:hypothetical protein